MANSIEEKAELRIECERLVREMERFCREEAESVRLKGQAAFHFMEEHHMEIPAEMGCALTMAWLKLDYVGDELEKIEKYVSERMEELAGKGG